MTHWKALIGSGLILLGSAWLNSQTSADSPRGIGSIDGIVLFEDGTPAHTGKSISEEVAVNVEVQTPTGTWARYGGAAHTDERGHYHIEGLPAGKYVVFAAFPGEWVQTSKGMERTGGPILFAPGIVRLSNARIIDITDNSNAEEVNVQVPHDSHHNVSGRVMNANGEPVSRGIVRLYASGEPVLSRSTPLSRDGSFTFANVADEEYTVLASLDGAYAPGPNTAAATITVHSGSDPEPLRLVLTVPSSQ